MKQKAAPHRLRLTSSGLEILATRATLATLATLATVFAVQGVASAAAPDPDRAKGFRDQAAGILKQADGFVALAAKSPGELAEAATNAATACREEADSLEALATAVGIGVAQDHIIHAAVTRGVALSKRKYAAIDRLNVRQAVAGLPPAAAAVEALTKATPEANKPLLDALLAARSRAIAAGAAVHAAIAPEADADAVEVLRDDFLRAQHDIAIATRALNAANERARLAPSARADRPAEAALLAEIAARDEEVLAAQRAVLAAELDMRAADRARNAAGKAYAATTWVNVTSLTLEQARAWAALENKSADEHLYDEPWHVLDGLTSLTPEVAEVIAKPKRKLSLGGLTEISPGVAAKLASREPIDDVLGLGAWDGDLRLNGLKRLSPEAAAALAAHPGNLLLEGLETLDSVPLAQKLARQKKELRLGLTDLTPEIAAELAKHRGFARFNCKYNQWGRHDRAASILRLDNIRSLSSAAAEALAAHEGVLVLNGLESLDPAVAAALARRVGNSQYTEKKDSAQKAPPVPGTLILNGLPAISTEAAAALAAFTGEIALKGVTEISPETAAALAKHKGRLYLTGLVTLSPEAYAALEAHPEVLLPRPLPLASR